MKRTARVAGATGLVGYSPLQRLLRDPAYGQVRALARRPLGAAMVRIALSGQAGVHVHHLPRA